MKNKISILMVLLLCISLLAACSKKPDNGSSKEELVVGMELAYPPFETTDEKGNATGISVDLAQDLGKYLGKKVRIQNIAYSGLLPSLTSKKIDIILSSMTITEERKKSIDFSDPYAKTNLALLINKNSPVKEPKDLNAKGKKVAVKKGTTGHIYAEKNLPNAEIMVFDKESACVLEVSQGKADAFIYDQLTIYKNWKQYEDSTKAYLNPIAQDFEYWGIGLRKEDKDLKEKINSFLAEYKKNGGFDKLGEKYLSEQKKTFEKLEIPFFF